MREIMMSDKKTPRITLEFDCNQVCDVIILHQKILARRTSQLLNF